jgi:enoyl-[acyl-carrier protein] reductase III
MNDFETKTAFVTGASRGIGRAIALELAKDGCDILIHFRKNREEAELTKKAVEALGRKTWLYQADLCDLHQTDAMLEHIQKEHKTLDIYVANAASTAFKSLSHQTADNVTKTFTLVVQSFLTCVQKLQPLLKAKSGRILTISGIDTVQYCPGHGLLAAAKSALETLTHYFAVELASDGIKAKCLNPGLVASDSTKFYLGENFDAICEAANATAPQGGFKEPEAVAKLALFLLSPASDWIATKTLYADGGLSFILPAFGK